MRILIISRAFYPRISPRSFRTTALAKEFARQGHDVIVYIPKDPIVHPQLEKEYSITIKDIGIKPWKKLNWGGILGEPISRVVNRVLNVIIDYPNIEFFFKVNSRLKKEKEYDLLISIAVPYPIHWGVALTRRKRKVANCWVADCGDPFMGNDLDSFKKPFYFKYVEKWFMRKANYVSITKMSFKVNYYKEFHEKLVEIPQGFDFNEFGNLNVMVNNKIPHFAYAGMLSKSHRDPSIFLRYLNSLDKEFKFSMYTTSADLVQPFVIESNGRIEVKGKIPREDLLKELSAMDFLVNFEYDPEKQSPSKLIDYALTKRPILNIVEKDFDSKIVDEFLSGDYSNQFEIPNLDNYRIENVCGRFLSLFDESKK